jgi:hypothetical protein
MLGEKIARDFRRVRNVFPGIERGSAAGEETPNRGRLQNCEIGFFAAPIELFLALPGRSHAWRSPKLGLVHPRCSCVLKRFKHGRA